MFFFRHQLATANLSFRTDSLGQPGGICGTDGEQVGGHGPAVCKILPLINTLLKPCDHLASCVTQAVYTALKETESRATDLLPLWKVPLLCHVIPRQRKAAAAVDLIRRTTEQLVARCKEMVEAGARLRETASSS